VIEWLPTTSADVALVATPPESGELPSEVAPSKNSTVPVAADGVTVAVSVTLSPTTDGFGALVTAVVVLAFVTECKCTGDVLPPKLASPE
jgi:ribosomal protein S5